MKTLHLLKCILRWMLAMAFVAAILPTPASAETPKSISMKMLVISADGNEPIFFGIKSVLNQIGVPYDTLIAKNEPLTARRLSDGAGAGQYQAILLTTGNLAYEASPGNYQSAFTQAQWDTLWQYERDFRVRQVTLYTYPAGAPDTYGLVNPVPVDTTTSPLSATLTSAGKQFFSYLNPNGTLVVKNAYTYLAKPASVGNPVALLQTADGDALASVYTYPDGRQNLTLTMDGNPDLVHTLALGYGAVNWAGKGVFLGSRKVYMSPQPDDLLLANDLWDTQLLSDATGLEYRITGADFNSLISWQKALRGKPTTANVRLEIPFNGEGAAGIYANDTLTPAVRKGQGNFAWISHTYGHELLDAISAADAYAELQKNHSAANQLKLGLYFKDSMVQPEISGLANPNFFAAAKSFGIKYILSDTSQAGWGSPSPNTGIYSTIEPSILVIPRYPTNLYYNVSTPTEWVSEYNYFYAPGGRFPTWDHALSYEEILDKESEIWLRYMLRFDVNPVMFHQTNLRSAGNSSLLGDLMGATLAKYNSIYGLPVISLAQHHIGVAMADRMKYDKSGVNGTILLSANGNTITLKTTGVVSAPVTGVQYGPRTETYGGEAISIIAVKANGSVAGIPAPAW